VKKIEESQDEDRYPRQDVFFEKKSWVSAWHGRLPFARATSGVHEAL